MSRGFHHCANISEAIMCVSSWAFVFKLGCFEASFYTDSLLFFPALYLFSISEPMFVETLVRFTSTGCRDHNEPQMVPPALGWSHHSCCTFAYRYICMHICCGQNLVLQELSSQCILVNVVLYISIVLWIKIIACWAEDRVLMVKGQQHSFSLTFNPPSHLDGPQLA